MADATGEKQPRKPRRPKREIGAEEIADQRARAEWTRQKLEILEAVLHDPRMNAKRFRLFAYVLQRTNYRNRVGIVHDQQIMDEVPGFGDDESIRRNRKAIREIGWWDYTPGRGTRSTIYTPRADLIGGVMSLIRIKAEARKEAHAYRKEALRSGKETLEQQHQTTNEMRGKRVRRSPQNAGELPCENEGITPSLTPSGYGEEATGRRQDVELRPAALTPQAEVVCPDCGTVAEAGVMAGPRCTECESEALRFESQGRELPRSGSGEFLCIDCMAETQLVARYKSEPYYPFCRDCIEASEFPDVKLIAAQKSYADASRGR
ncbi:hypothetical protein [Methylobacterium sp. NEAU K]|uniref:hypothetical protein n=1 Tax=Methylobacterium sp. NEAU K TaxID=3064946 RepID=UPI002736FF7C|nr:hypothetical protein [Methylobacterium sp. NEAU K]MDP4006395.1 hypothetical protein [Methylobacterium sp. NEAU K]